MFLTPLLKSMFDARIVGADIDDAVITAAICTWYIWIDIVGIVIIM